MQMILRPPLCAAFMGDRSNVIEMRVAKPVWQLSGGSLTQKPTCDIGVCGAKKEPHFKNATKGQNLIFVKYGYLRVRSVLPYTQVCFSHGKESMLLVHMPVGGRVRGRWDALWFDDDFEQGWFSQHSCVNACQCFTTGPLPQPPCSLTSSPTGKSCPQPNPASPPPDSSLSMGLLLSNMQDPGLFCDCLCQTELQFPNLVLWAQHALKASPDKVKEK